MKTATAEKVMETLIGHASEAQVEAWKKSHLLGIFAVKKAGRIAYFKLPGFSELDAYNDLSDKENATVTDGWKDLAGLLYLGGCEELITSPLYLGNVVRRIEEAMVGEKAELVKL